MKIKLILACVFIALVVILLGIITYQSNRIDTLKTAKNGLEANNQLLINKMKRAYDDKLEISRKNKELENLAKSVVNFDWNTDISGDVVALWLRENAIRVQRDRARAD